MGLFRGKNAEICRTDGIQDTGMVVAFLEIGQDVNFRKIMWEDGRVIREEKDLLRALGAAKDIQKDTFRYSYP